METHVMTFFVPPSSGLYVKSCLRCSDISASPSAPCCFSKTLAWNAHSSSAPLCSHCGDAACGTLDPHRAHALPTARSDFPVLRKKKKKTSKGGISLSVYYLSEKGRMVRKRNFCQADENLPWPSFGGRTAAGNPIVFLRLFALQICFLKRADVTQPFKPCDFFIVHTLPDNLWLFLCDLVWIYFGR